MVEYIVFITPERSRGEQGRGNPHGARHSTVFFTPLAENGGVSKATAERKKTDEFPAGRGQKEGGTHFLPEATAGGLWKGGFPPSQRPPREGYNLPRERGGEAARQGGGGARVPEASAEGASAGDSRLLR